MVTTDYELCSSAGCTGYVNISNQQYQNIDLGPQSSSLRNHQLFRVHKNSLYRPVIHVGHRLFPTDRLNGSIPDSKMGELQNIFPRAIWCQSQRTVSGTFNVLVLKSTSGNPQGGTPTSTEERLGYIAVSYLVIYEWSSNYYLLTLELCWEIQKTLGYSTIPIRSIFQNPYKDAMRLTFKQKKNQSNINQV